MKVKIIGDGAYNYKGKVYGKNDEVNGVSKEQFDIWDRLGVAKEAKSENKGQQTSAAKKGIGNGKGKGAAKKAENELKNAAKNENKTTGETFTPLEG